MKAFIGAVVLSFLVLATTCDALRTERSNTNPGAVAKMMVSIEQRWLEQAKGAINRTQSDRAALEAVEESCVKVAKSVVTGAEGNKERVASYMREVCENVPQGTTQTLCQDFGSGITAFISPSEEYNKHLQLWKFCDNFYSETLVRVGVESLNLANGKQRKMLESIRLRTTEAEDALHFAKSNLTTSTGKKKEVALHKNPMPMGASNGSVQLVSASKIAADSTNSTAALPSSFTGPAPASSSLGLPSWRLPASLPQSLSPGVPRGAIMTAALGTPLKGTSVPVPALVDGHSVPALPVPK